MRTKRAQEIVLTAIAVGIAVLVALNSVRYFVRFDLTRNREQSISDVSRSLFEELDSTLQLTYYVSDRLRARAGQPQQIIDLLQRVSDHGFHIIKTEHLYTFDGEPGFSLGQGQ